MRGRVLLLFAPFLAAAIAWTWPLTLHLSSRIPHDPGDPILNAWLLWWNAHAVPFTERWWNPPIFFPMRGALALSEHLAGIGLIATPVQLAGLSALTAYNISFILSFALSGCFAFLLVRRLAADSPSHLTRDLAAVCGGLAYGFAPYRAGQLAHLQVLTSQWMPLALLAMHAYLDDGRRRWLMIFASAWLVQALSNGYYLLFFPVLVILWLAWFVDWRRAPRRGVELLLTWGSATVLLAPMLIKYAMVQRGLGLVRTSEEMVIFSAKPASFFKASSMLVVWPSSEAATTEEFLFPGVTSILLVAIAAGLAFHRSRRNADMPDASGRRRRSPFIFYSVAALLMCTFALGPPPPDAGVRALLHPYGVLTYFPGFEALRVPARFAMLGTLCISVAAGLAFARVAPRRPRACALVAAVAILGLLADGWIRAMPLATPPGRVILPDVRNALVVELPANVGPVDVGAMYRQTLHGEPIVNGYSGHTPPHYVILALSLQRGDPSALLELARGRPLVISVNQAFDPGGSVQRIVDGLPAIRAIGGSSAGAMYLLPALPRSYAPPAGDPWPESLRNPSPNVAEIDLGQPRVIRTIGFPLRWHYRELDRQLTIEASPDGSAWSTIWQDWTGGPAFAGAIIDPRDVPIRMTVPDVTARYVRVHPAPRWMRGELRLYGPK